MTLEKAWSFSALNNFETCPKKYYHLSVAKDVKEPPSDHMTHGNRIHTAFQYRVREGKSLPIGTRQYEPFLNILANLPGEISVEQKLAVTADFSPCEWFAKNTWTRCVIDYLCIQGTKALVVDYKTGKRKDDDVQLSLMCGMVFLHMKEIDEIHASFFWMQEPVGQQVDTLVLLRSDLPMIYSRMAGRVDRFQKAHKTTDFPAQPGGLCRRYCPVKSCVHNGK